MATTPPNRSRFCLRPKLFDLLLIQLLKLLLVSRIINSFFFKLKNILIPINSTTLDLIRSFLSLNTTVFTGSNHMFRIFDNFQMHFKQRKRIFGCCFWIKPTNIFSTEEGFAKCHFYDKYQIPDSETIRLVWLHTMSNSIPCTRLNWSLESVAFEIKLF